MDAISIFLKQLPGSCVHVNDSSYAFLCYLFIAISVKKNFDFNIKYLTLHLILTFNIHILLLINFVIN